MSRSGYDCDIDNWRLIKWRGAVASATRGKRGQAFLREMLAALDTMPEKRLAANVLAADGEVCAIGAVGARRGTDMAALDPEDFDSIAAAFGIAAPLAREVEWQNDEAAFCDETPEDRWVRMREWVASQIR